MRIVYSLRTLLTLQVIVFGWAIQILYSSSHDGVSDFSGLAAILPLGIFLLLGIVSLVLLIIYFVKLKKSGLTKDILVIILAIVNTILVLSYNSISSWAQSGPG